MARQPNKSDRLSRELARTVLDFGRFLQETQWGIAHVVAVSFERDESPYFLVRDALNRDGLGCLVKGLNSLAIHAAVAIARLAPDDLQAGAIEQLLGGVATLGRLDQETLWLHQESGGTGRRESLVPFLLAHEPVSRRRRPRKAEQRLFLGALRSFLAATEAGVLRPTAATNLEVTPTLVVSGEAYAPEWRLEHRRFELPELDIPADPPFSSAELTRWKRLDAAVRCLIKRGALRSGHRMPGPMDFYFSRDMTDDLLHPDGDVVMSCYLEWFVRDWTWIDEGPTVLHRLLDEYELVAEERQLIEERIARKASIYRVEAILDAETVRLVDLHSDEIRDVKDRGVARAVRPGDFLPLRLIAAGPFHFPVILGPVLTSMTLEASMRMIEETCEHPAPACFDLEPEVFGRLFDVVFGTLASPLPTQNTEGHRLVIQTLRIEVLDHQAVTRQLDAHEEFERLHGEESWGWFGEAEAQGSRTLRGQMRFEDPRTLLIEVNSEERKVEVLSWLETIVGLGAIETEVHDLETFMKERSHAPQLATEQAEMFDDPALQEQLRTILDGRMMAWLDEAIPALDMKTPREAVKSPTYREKVKTLIRSMPNPTRQIPYEVPRAAMFRELGLA